METIPVRSVRLNRPFRFQEFWLSDMSFLNVVSSAWGGNRNLAESIEVFSKEATCWNRNHFGNIHQKKRRIMARIYGVQKAISNWLSSSLINLEDKLHQELEVVLDQERDLWMLKSRINWMIQGDCNTSFYHVSALARRKRNHIASVKDERGVWLTMEREVMEHFRNGFISLYTTSLEEASWVPRQNVRGHVHLSEEIKDMIGGMVTSEEIRDALWSMKPYKAPG
ncbi:uncharacterized protein LOC126719321 [Quercus robur]|uniref:uncharacterized protein LOC126719321 n=1 Tax=Quercus robur TaxID=38942 RepID=UPI002161AB66|nr:uncharacterized protein LOC126719321 [Quercus robur]